MFLDDQIVEIVVNAGDNFSRQTIDDIFKACMDRLKESLHENMADANIKPATKRVCNSFDAACIKLEKLGMPYLEKGGLEKWFLNHPKLGPILKRLNY